MKPTLDTPCSAVLDSHMKLFHCPGRRVETESPVRKEKLQFPQLCSYPLPQRTLAEHSTHAHFNPSEKRDLNVHLQTDNLSTLTSNSHLLKLPIYESSRNSVIVTECTAFPQKDVYGYRPQGISLF